VSTLKELMKKQGQTVHADIEWLHLLVAEWQLIADLSFADLILWVRGQDGTYLAVANARPSSASTMLYRDITGDQARKQWIAGLDHSHETGDVFFTALEVFDGNKARFEVIPVRRRVNAKSDAAEPTPIAFITRHTAIDVTVTPNRISINYMQAANDLLGMVSSGQFPDFNTPTGPKRGAPRASDGLIRLDDHGKVTFASPNGISVLGRIGVKGELEGKLLIEEVSAALKNSNHVDESLSLVLTGRAAWRTDVEAGQGTISMRAIPFFENGVRGGAIVLCRDVTELRRQERELITKDATIREIHHRVKNNLQTVASLLRIQARRSTSEDVREELDQAMRRVSAIALVHDTLSEGVNQDLNFDEVFDRVLLLTSEVAASHNTSVKTLIDGKFGQLRSEIATPLAVALTEIVHNAVEHGLANRSGVVHVSAERKGKKLEITVSDNGTGLKNGTVGTGLGTQIIKTLIEGELRGTISWLSPADGGTRVIISIPL
jgi:two-component sensor histidine kinase/PAS domain-containing protein